MLENEMTKVVGEETKDREREKVFCFFASELSLLWVLLGFFLESKQQKTKNHEKEISDLMHSGDIFSSGES